MTPDSAVPVLLIGVYLFAAFVVVDVWERWTR
jgi:hypothetical protein